MAAVIRLRVHVTTVVQSCFAVLRRIRRVRRVLPRHALLTLVRALIVSTVNYTAIRFSSECPCNCMIDCSQV